MTVDDLYQEYKQDVYHYLLGQTHDPSLAEDLLSETFLRALEGIGSFRGDSSIKTWLIGISRHVWLQHLRKSKHQVEQEDLLEVYLTESLEDRCITRHTAGRIKELLDTKDERTRSIVWMRVEGWPFSEIAEKWGIQPNSARVIDFRTRKWIRQTLEKEELL